MGRIRPLEYRMLDEESRALLDEGERMMGFVPNDALTMARVPGLLSAILMLTVASYGPGRVDAETKRLVALISSTAAGCRYCQGHVRHGGLRRGMSPERLDAVWDFETSPLFSEKERSALRVAQRAALQPNAVEDCHFDALKQHYTEDEIAEIVAVIALFGFLNRWNDTVATDIEDLPREALNA